MRPLRLDPRSVGGWRQLTVSRTTMLMVAVLMRRRCSSAAAAAVSSILVTRWPAHDLKAPQNRGFFPVVHWHSMWPSSLTVLKLMCHLLPALGYGMLQGTEFPAGQSREVLHCGLSACSRTQKAHWRTGLCKGEQEHHLCLQR